MDRRFTRARRLTEAGQYQAVFADASACSSAYFTLLAIANTQDFARLGLAIAKRRIPKSVGRSRVKRIVRESFRHHHELLAGVDVVVLARDRAVSASGVELRRTLDQQWQRLSSAVAERANAVRPSRKKIS